VEEIRVPAALARLVEELVLRFRSRLPVIHFDRQRIATHDAVRLRSQTASAAPWRAAVVGFRQAAASGFGRCKGDFGAGRAVGR